MISLMNNLIFILKFMSFKNNHIMTDLGLRSVLEGLWYHNSIDETCGGKQGIGKGKREIPVPVELYHKMIKSKKTLKNIVQTWRSVRL